MNKRKLKKLTVVGVKNLILDAYAHSRGYRDWEGYCLSTGPYICPSGQRALERARRVFLTTKGSPSKRFKAAYKAAYFSYYDTLAGAVRNTDAILKRNRFSLR